MFRFNNLQVFDGKKLTMWREKGQEKVFQKKNECLYEKQGRKK